MSAFTDSYESDLSDAVEGSQEVTAWLDEEDDEPEPEPVKKIVVEQPKISVVQKPPYIVKHLDLFFALCELEDWDFERFSDELQEEIMRTLIIEVYQPGDRIIVEGDIGNDMYIIVATEETAHFAEVEVINQNLLAGTEVFLTRLRRGQYFGQKFFLTRRAVRIFHFYNAYYNEPLVTFSLLRINVERLFEFQQIHRFQCKSRN